MVMDDIWSLAGAAKESKSRQESLPVGAYVVAVEHLKKKRAEGGGKVEKGTPFAEVRYRVVTSSNADVTAGQSYGEVFFVTGANGATHSQRLRKLGRAIADLPDTASDNDVTDALKAMDDDGNPCRGVKIRVFATEATNKAGGHYVKTTYEAIPQNDEEIAKSRAWLDSSDVVLQAAEEIKQATVPASEGKRFKFGSTK